jgi:rhomboid protease GluP
MDTFNEGEKEGRFLRPAEGAEGTENTAPPRQLPRLPIVTVSLIGICVAVFIILTLKGGSQNTLVLLRYGAKDSGLIWEGQYWRLITPIFLHAGLTHLLLNAFSLFQMGGLIELMYGKLRMLVIFMASGFLATMASTIASPNISVGASGAIFGLFGALLYFGLRNPAIFRSVFGMRIYIVLAINLVMGVVIPNIDSVAHLGGLVGGFVTASGLGLPMERRPFSLRKRIVFAALAITFFAGCTLFVLNPSEDNWRYHYYSGQSLLMRSNYTRAAERLERANELKPDHKKVAELTAFALYADVATQPITSANILTVRARLQKALQLNPQLEEAQTLLDKVNQFIP